MTGEGDARFDPATFQHNEDDDADAGFLKHKSRHDGQEAQCVLTKFVRCLQVSYMSVESVAPTEGERKLLLLYRISLRD